MVCAGDRQSCCVVPTPQPLLPPATLHQQRSATAAITDDYLLQSNCLISKSSRAQRCYQAAASAAVHSSGKMTAWNIGRLRKSSVGWLEAESLGLVVVGGFSLLGQSWFVGDRVISLVT